MPAKSQAQEHLMQAAAHTPGGYGGVSQEAAQKFLGDSMESARIQDINGFWEVKDNPISKVGVFMYSGRVIGQGLPPDQMFAVYRPAEELADPECAASFRLMPWIDNHPKKLLGNPKQGFSDPAQSTIAGVIGEQIYFDDADLELKANLKLLNFTHDERINAGKKELSIGYRCIYVRESGEYNGIPYDFVQRKIRGNHIASVKNGRSGPDISVMDSVDAEVLDEFTATFDNAEYTKMATATQSKKPAAGKKSLPAHLVLKKTAAYIGSLHTYAADAAEEEGKKGDGASGEFKQLAELLGQVKPLMEALSALPIMGNSEATAAMPEDEDAMDKEPPEGGEPPEKKEGEAPPAAKKEDDKPKDGSAMDAAEVTRIATAAAVAAVQEALKPVTGKISSAMDAAEMHAEIQRKGALVEAVKPFVGVFDHAEMTHAQVATYAADKLKLNAPKGQELTALNAYLVGRKPPKAMPAARAGMDAAEGADKAADSLRNKLTGQTVAA